MSHPSQPMGESADRRALLRDALRAVDEMQAKLDAAERSRNEPIAIVGVGCRFPGAVASPEDYWRVLRDGVDAVTEIPPGRWGPEASLRFDPDGRGQIPTCYGGFLDSVDRFDPRFFGISPREAATMDPQQRLVLEVAWEALERAGIAADRLAGSATGVFIGITTSDYLEIVKAADPGGLDVYTATGNAHNAVAGRLSYLLGLQGPSMAIDTACSSSLVAIHLACQSLRLGESQLALAGGVNVILGPDAFVCFTRWGMMAPDGHCKTFDAAADGFVRAEGCGIVALKRLSDAQADGDPVLAVIRGSAVNQDGASSGLTVPNGLAQQAVLRRALAQAGVSPAAVGYVEAHGTGTTLGDPIELEAIDAVLGEGRAAEHRLVVGSVKTNLGHLESASGVAGLIKVVLALQHDEIPPHLHFRTLNPKITLRKLDVLVPTQRVPWPAGDEPRIAGVSSFGFSGTNAHIVLAEAPARPPAAPVDRPAYQLVLSAKSEPALQALAARYERHIAGEPVGDLGDVCFTAATGRAQFVHRVSLVADSAKAMRESLSTFAASGEAAAVATGRVAHGTRPRVAFLFSGQGSQFPGMSRQLYDTHPVFREALECCAKILRPSLDRPLLDVLFAAKGSTEARLLGETAYTQPALFAVEWALVEVLRASGVAPAAVLGHSVGEYVAAVVAGVLEVEDALRLIAERGRMMQALPAGGAMAAVFADEARVAAAIAPHARLLAIAAVNASDNVVISGDGATLQSVLAALATEGIGARPLTVSHAFHSPLLDPILGTLETAAARVPARAPSLPLVSNLTGSIFEPGEVPDAAYWRRHAREAVRFGAGISTLAARGITTFVEVGPGTALLGLGRRTLSDPSAAWLPTLRPGRGEWAQVLETLGALWMRGVEIAWRQVQPGQGRRVVLPTYPFQDERCWIAPGPASGTAPRQLAAASHRASGHPLLLRRVELAGSDGVHVWEGVVSLAHAPFITDHRVQGQAVVPATLYLELALAAAAEALGEGAVTVSGMEFRRPIFLRDDAVLELQITLTSEGAESASFRIHSRPAAGDGTKTGGWTLNVTGRLRREHEPAPSPVAADLPSIKARCTEELDGAEFYRLLAQRGNEWGPAFQGVQHLWRAPGEAVSRLRVPEAVQADVGRYRLHPALADTSGHVLVATVPLERSAGHRGGAFVGGAIDEVRVYRRPRGSELWSHARLRTETAERSNMLVGDVRVIDSDGALVSELRGARLWYLDQSSSGAGEGRSSRLYRVAWEPAPRVAAAPREPAGIWLILADAGGFGEALGGQLCRVGAQCLLAHASDTYRIDGGRSQVRPGYPEDLERFLADFAGDVTGLRGVVYLWGLDGPSGDEVSVPAMDIASRQACEGLVGTVRAMAGLRGGTAPRLWVVTRGAQSVGETATPLALSQAPLWGLGRTMSVEHPEFWGGLVDIDLHDVPTAAAERLLGELLGPDGEDQVAFRDHTRHVARLVPGAGTTDAAPLRFRPDASYLLTGGLGGLGLKVAHWMVEQGARRLVLVGRTPLPPRGEWMKAGDDRVGHQIAAIRELEHLGASVHMASVDTGDELALAEFLETFAREGWPPIRGVVHAAGVVHYGAAVSLGADDLAAAFRAKVRGAWALDRALCESTLDFFVMFSSASSVLSSPFVGAYAAANAFLDALAHDQRARGRPGLAINWGLWAGAGMAEQLSAGDLEILATRGMGTLSVAEALEALGTLMAAGSGQVAVIPTDWSRWRELYPAFTRAPFLSALLEGSIAETEHTPGRPSLRDALAALESDARASHLVAAILEYVGRVLRLPADQLDAGEPLTGLGLDSLMALELKNRIEADLGVTVPLVHYLDGSSPAQLGAMLIDRVNHELTMRTRTDAGHAMEAAEASALLERLDQLSEEEIDGLLARMSPPDGEQL